MGAMAQGSGAVVALRLLGFTGVGRTLRGGDRDEERWR